MEFSGKIKASEVAYIKFQISGKLASVNCKIGDTVKKGQLLATLEKTELQAYLERALKEYDLERALFDEKQKQELTEYEKRKYQDSLDISVKNVEIAKANLNATDLYSSIEGIVTEMDPGQPGENITPAGFVITVVNPKSLFFEGELPEEELSQTSVGQPVKVSLKAFPDKTFEGKIEKIGFSPLKEGIFPVFVSLSNLSDLRLGLTGKATF
ncbi:MAG: efflux RND transporter periplasmic adaptor subunit [Patescibacteria group bacterium]